MKLTIFDLDNTLLAGDSDYTWGNFLVAKGVVNADQYQLENERFYLEYQRKTLDIFAYQRFVLAPLMVIGVTEREALHAEFMQHYIAPLRQVKADALIAKHKAQADTLLVITATNRFIAEPIVSMLNIDHLLATDPEIINDQFTGNIVGTPCFQEGKIERLKQWMDSNSEKYSEITFYSDSINDAPLLEFVDHAIAVDPDDDLHALALEKGWAIISLRD
ncbi:MAG: HAD superfamily hydrolase (TIGR01490 family) [Kiritimatiellia bacterium]|jgi:HAD superfamily hydrolase (TIGR01490 family)